MTVLAATAGAQPPAEGAVSSPPELTLWSSAGLNPLMNAGRAGYFISVERDAYVAAFEVARDGRMRVLYPRSPKDDGRVKGGKSVSVVPWSYDIFSIGVSPINVPYVVALASDSPIDLSRFGKGKTWQYRVRLDGTWQAEETMENVGRLVQRDSTQRFSGDYGYVAPRIAPSTYLALSQCLNMSTFAMGRDSRDYWLYRDLWMSFGPRDGFWFGSAAPWLGWGFNGFVPMIFPSTAGARIGGGCAEPMAVPRYAFAPMADPFTPRPVRPPSDSSQTDSARTDTTRASAGRTIALEQPRGTDGLEGASRPETRRFSREDIARLRSEFYARPGRDGRAPGEASAARPERAFVDRSGGSSWAPEPLERRPSGTAPGGISRWAQEEGMPRGPVAGMNGGRPGRYDPERANATPRPAGSSSGSSGSTGWQRPTSVGGADVTRAASPATGTSTGSSGGGAAASPARSEGGARSPVSGGSSPAGSAPVSAPRGQQQQQQQQQ